jgi:hypothetical protein
MEASRLKVGSGQDRTATYADMFAALGAEPRLRILRALLAAHPEGMVVGEIQHDGIRGNLQNLGRLVRAQAAKETELDYTSVARVHLCKSIQGVVERNQFPGSSRAEVRGYRPD